jgi:hypothetical protein
MAASEDDPAADLPGGSRWTIGTEHPLAKRFVLGWHWLICFVALAGRVGSVKAHAATSSTGYRAVSQIGTIIAYFVIRSCVRKAQSAVPALPEPI